MVTQPEGTMSVSVIMAAVRGVVSRDAYKYSALPGPATSQRRRGDQEPSPPQRHARMAKISIGGMALFVFLFMIASFSQGHPTPGCELIGNCTGDMSHIWGQYSPWFSVPSEIDASMPEGCQVTFAQVLSRHGARWPTAKKSTEYKSTINRIKGVVTNYGSGYDFIKHYEYSLGADELTAFGQQQMVESGVAFYQRYRELANEDSVPFIRASGSGRVIASAENFTTGFFGVLGRDPSDLLKGILVLPEDAEFNNTLNHGACPAFEGGPASKVKDEKQTAWLGKWAPPIMQRLNERLPGANLTLTEAVYMMDLCPYNTVASPNATLSDFCRLFSHEEWTDYDYYQSLDKWYGYGNGNPLGPSQGVGFANELIARLTGKPVEDHTTTNTTLDSSPNTFPLDRKLYADFSHDNTMSSIFAALGLYDGNKDLPVNYKLSPHQTHGFSSAWVVPFSARMYVEKMQCGNGEEMVRVLVNDRIIPLKGCGADDLGRCKLSAFVKSLSFVRNGGRWSECHSAY